MSDFYTFIPRFMLGGILILLSLSCTSVQDPPLSVFDTVHERGYLICGIEGNLPGLSETLPPGRLLPPFDSFDTDYGDFKGFDVDFCRAIAVAIFGDDKAVRFIPLKTLPSSGPTPLNERFQAVLNGNVDVLIRNTTWTASRDTGMSGREPQTAKLSVDFGPVIFYDGQRILVRKPEEDRVPTLKDVRGTNICVPQGTTSLENLRRLGGKLGYSKLVDRPSDQIPAVHARGECNAISADMSRLLGDYGGLLEPGELVAIEEPISEEPLAPVFVENDSKWRDVISWVVYVTIHAETLGINQSNAREKFSSSDPEIQSLQEDMSQMANNLGLINDFAYQIILEVGSYQDIYQRNFGELQRGRNRPWRDGGLLYAPPLR